jgi:hypothetical protein
MRIPISCIGHNLVSACSFFALLVGVPVVTAGVIANALSDPPPEREELEIAIEKQKLMRKPCKRIAKKITACYTGRDSSVCSEIKDSNAWFFGAFGEYPEMACPTAYDPLTLGAR